MLTLDYGARVGTKSNYTQLPFQLNDRMQVQVNPTTGNMLLSERDFAIEGTGQRLDFTRYFNSLKSFSSLLNSYDGWSSLPTDYLSYGNWDGSFALQGQDGAIYPFGKTVDNATTWTEPPGISATPSGGGNGTTLTYNGDGSKYTLNSNGFLTSYKDKNGNAIAVGCAYPCSVWTRAITTLTDTQGRTATWTYDSGSQLLKIQDSSGRYTMYNWDPSYRRMTSFQDTAGKTTSYSYYAYDGPDGVMNQIDTPEGRRTILNYDPSGRITSLVRVTNQTNNTGPMWGFAYYTDTGAASGHTVVIDPNNHQTVYYYDDHSQVTKVIDANGHAQQKSYTPHGDANLLTGANAASDVTTLNYSGDGKNNLTSFQEPATASGQSPATTRFSYAASNQNYYPSSKTDAQGNCKSFTYDTAGNMTDVYDGQSSSCSGGSQWQSRYKGDPGVTCSYQASPGELCYTQDPKGNRTNYAYDARGNLVATYPPSPLGQTTVVPDALSRPTKVTDGKGQVTTYSYDNLDRVVQILYAGATSCTAYTTCSTFSYDGDGNLISRTDATGATTFTYDSLNRLIDKSTSSSFACGRSSPTGITFAYDGNSNLTSYCDAGGVTTYGYDAANHLIALAEPGGSVTAGGTCNAAPCTAFTYDNDNRRQATTFPGGARLVASYDGAGNEKTIVGTSANNSTLTSFTYGYAAGTADKNLRQSMNDNTTTWTYTYDSSNRLTDAVPGSGTAYHYRYDADGNRCRIDTRPCGTSSPPDSYAYNAANELCYSGGTTSGTCSAPPTGATTYSYDANGNLTATSAGGSFTYNAKNQSTAITYGGATLTPLAYADVDQSERTVGGTTSFMSDAFGPVAIRTSSTNTYVIRDNKGEIIGERVSGTSYYFLKDGIGSVVAVVSGSGTLKNNYRYDPFGQPDASSESVTNPWRYASGYRDSTGLYKFGTRYFDRTTGRWTQQDPVSGAVGQPSTQNRFTYAGDDPINESDPTGRFSIFGQYIGVLAVVAGLAAIATVVVAPVAAPVLAAGLIGGGATVLGGILATYCSSYTCP